MFEVYKYASRLTFGELIEKMIGSSQMIEVVNAIRISDGLPAMNRSEFQRMYEASKVKI